MRQRTIDATTYQPGDPPSDPALLQRFLREEMIKIAAAFAALKAAHFDATKTVPAKPRAGDIIYADGVMWDPGSGEGFYYYNSHGEWTPLG